MNLVSRPRIPAFFAGLAVLLGASVLLSLALGATPLDLLGALTGSAPADRLVLLHERLPRTILAAIVGASLSASGLVFQAVLSNPLADPYVIGVAGGAALGGTLALVIPGIALLGHAGVSAAAFLGGLGAVALTWRLSRDRRGRMRAYEVLLVGVVFNTIASAAIMFLKSVVRAEKAQEMLLWLMGTLAVALFALGMLFASAPALNALALGEEDAAAVGVDPGRTTRRVFLAGSLLVAAAVSVAGMIGFVGLIVPHAVRALVGSDHRVTIPGSALLGAAFLVLADLLTRLMFPVFDTEAPVGVLTALIGGPAFIWLLKRGGDRP
jgi:iron complex transport system permease protein